MKHISIQILRSFVLSAALLLAVQTEEGRGQIPLRGKTLTYGSSYTGASYDAAARDYVSLLPGFEYTPSGNGTFIARIDDDLIFDMDYLSQGQLVNPETRTLNINLAVGSTGGNMDVSATGGASYSIPVFTPPGTNGMQPGISLVYNSQSGNGVAGWGWNIAGMSAIARTSTDLFRDGGIGQFKNHFSDKLTLDGNRLICTSAYGTEGTQYAVFGTEVGNTMRVKVTGILGSDRGYNGFKVETKDGKTIEYGTTSDSRVSVSYEDGATTETCVVSWLIRKITDQDGNYIVFNYNSEGSEVWLSSIDYTGNDAAGLTPYASLEFKYSKRSDVGRRYMAIADAAVTNNNASIPDGFINETVLLREVQARYEGRIVRRYEMKYYNHPHTWNIGSESYTTKDYSFLSEVKEYGENNQSFNSTVFSYYDKEDIQSAVRYNTVSAHGISGWTTGKKADYLFGDFNGDGILDRMVVERDYDGASTPDDDDQARWYLQYGQYFECNGGLNCGSVGFTNASPDPYMFTTKDKRTHHWELLFDQALAADVNNDGKDDLIIPYWDGWDDVSGDEDNYDKLKVRVYTSNGSSFSMASEFDINNWFNGICNNDNHYCYMRYPVLQVGDFDGDRYLELIVNYLADDRELVYISGENFEWINSNQDRTVVAYADLTNSNGTIIASPTVEANKLCFDPTNLQLIAIPHNMNLKTDLLVIRDEDASLAENATIFERNTNGDFENKNFTIPLKARWKYKMGDLNGDGLLDLIYEKFNDATNDQYWAHEIYYRYNTGQNFSEEYRLRDYVPLDMLVLDFAVADYNGDGKADIWMRYTPGSSQAVTYYMYFSKGYNSFDFQKFALGDEQYTRPYTNVNLLNIPYQGDYTPLGMDFNGDGKADLYNKYDDDENYIISFYANKKNLYLKSVSDGMGNRTQLSYDNISKGQSLYSSSGASVHPLRDVRTGLYVVSQMESFPYKHSTPQGSVSYVYKNAVVHWEKGFLGFKESSIKTKISDLQYSESAMEFEIDAVKYVMNPKKTTNYMYSRSDISFNYSQDILSTATLVNSRVDLGLGRYFYYASKVTEDNALTATVKTTESSYDNWQNLTQSVVKYGNPSSPRATETTTTTYTNAGTWCNSKPDYTTITKTHADDPANPDIRNTDHVYYGSSKNYHLEKSIGDPGKSKSVTTKLNYDAFGNITSMTLAQTDPQNGDPNLADREKGLIFDSRGRFPIKQDDGLGFITKKIYNPVSGNTLTLIDAQGLTTRFEYDDFGREKYVIGPTNVLSSTSLKYNPNSSEHSTMLYYREVQASNAPNIKSWFSSTGREVKTEKESFGGQTIIVEKEYFNDGRIKKQIFPHFSGTNEQREISYEYDKFLRQSKLKNNGRETTMSYAGRKVVTEDPAENETSKTVDELGNLVESTETISLSNTTNTVRYFYDGAARVKSITTDAINQVNAFTVQYEYDDYGNKTKSIDPDAGTYLYEYNAFGELTKQTDPRGYSETFSADALGRVIGSEIRNNTSVLQYKIETVYTSAGSSGGGKPGSLSLYEGSGTSPAHKVEFAYDAFGREIKKDEHIGPDQFIRRKTYNWLNQLVTEEYPSGVKAEYEYNSAGQMTKVRRVDGGLNKVIWELGAIDAFGKAMEIELAGGAITTNYSYDSYEMPNTIITNAGSTSIQDLQFQFHPQKRVLEKRWDHRNNQSEEFDYDELYRLTSYAVNGGAATTMSYYNDGSIENKSDVGIYRYTDLAGDVQNPPHAVKRVGPDNSYKPDAQDMIYNALNRVQRVTEGLFRNDFVYGADRERVKSSFYQNTLLKYDKYYLHDYEKISYANGNTKEISYLHAPNGIVAAVIKEKTGSSPATEQTVYIHTDYLGSIQSLSREVAGQPGVYERIAEFAYDPWGRLRQEGNWALYYSSENAHAGFSILGRGFTGHEHMPEFGLINMNARLYDPVMARFFSPDNYLQAPDYAQNYNRFSYAFNNPLSYTDPTGNVAWFIPMITGAIVGGIITAMTTRHVTVFEAFAKGAIVGAVGGVFSMIGGGALVSNVSLGVLQGGLTGLLDGVLWGRNVGQSAAIGIAAGAGFALLTSGIEATRNLIDGYGFKLDDDALADLIATANASKTKLDYEKVIGFVQNRFNMTHNPITGKPVKMTYNAVLVDDNNNPAKGITHLFSGDIEIGPNGFIDINGALDINSLKATMAHEYGHSVYDRVLDAAGNGIAWKYNRKVNPNWWNGVVDLNDPRLFPHERNILIDDGVIGYSMEIANMGRLGLTQSPDFLQQNVLYAIHRKSILDQIPMRRFSFLSLFGPTY